MILIFIRIGGTIEEKSINSDVEEMTSEKMIEVAFEVVIEEAFEVVVSEEVIEGSSEEVKEVVLEAEDLEEGIEEK